MKTWKRVSATFLAAAALSGGLAFLAAPASNATYAVSCASEEDWYRIYGNMNVQCFATAGDLAAYQQNTYALTTGNNSGYISYKNNADGQWWNSTYRGHNYTGYFDWPYVNTSSVHLR